MKCGYARVSSTDQNLEAQIDKLSAAGSEKIWQEKVSGTSREGREALQEVLEYVREGDSLIVTRIDRLARSVKDLADIVDDLQHRGVNLECTEQPIDTSTAAGRCFLQMLGVFSEFETNLRKERQLDGIEKAKAKGVYKGRKATARAKSDEVLSLREQGLGASDIARKLGIGRASVYRILANFE